MGWSRKLKFGVSQIFGIPIAYASYWINSRIIEVIPFYVPIIWALTSAFVYTYFSKSVRPKRAVMFKRAVKITILAILINVYAILGYATYVNIQNIPNANFNPSPPVAGQFISLDYPPAQGFTVTGDLLHLNIEITTSGDFVQGQPVDMSVTGSISNRLLYNLSDIDQSLAYPEALLPNGTYVPYAESEIDVGFGGAANVMDGQLSYPIGGPSIGFVTLLINYTNPNSIQTLSLGDTSVGAPTQQIEWTSQGDYAPTISFSTGTYGYSNYTNIEQTYGNFTVQVASSDVLAQARYDRVDEVLTIVLVIFGFVEAAKIILDSLSEKKSTAAIRPIVHPINGQEEEPKKKDENSKPMQGENIPRQKLIRKERGKTQEKG